MKHFLVTGTVQVSVEADEADEAKEKASPELREQDVELNDMFAELDPEYHSKDEILEYEKARTD